MNNQEGECNDIIKDTKKKSSKSVCRGIYRINAPDGYYYYGSSSDIYYRWERGHKKKFRLGKHENSHMQRRYLAHPDGWSVELIEEVGENLLDVEQKYLDEHFGNPLCMNQNPIANAPPSRKGIKKTPQQIELHRIAITGKKHSQETKDKMSVARKGRIFTPEWRKNMSLAMKGAKQRATLRRQELCPCVAQLTPGFVGK